MESLKPSETRAKVFQNGGQGFLSGPPVGIMMTQQTLETTKNCKIKQNQNIKTKKPSGPTFNRSATLCVEKNSFQGTIAFLEIQHN